MSDIPEHHFDCLEDFKFNPGVSISNINFGRFTIPLYIKYDPENTEQVYMLNAAVDRNKIQLPYFPRFTWANEIPGTIIFPSDPTLTIYDNMRGGWWQGVTDDFVMLNLIKIIRHLKKVQGSKKVNIFGSSIGGFTSLYIGQYINYVRCIAINPQTDVTKYSRTSLKTIIRECYENISERRYRKQFAKRYSFQRGYENHKAGIVYFQNVHDTEHYSSHFSTFKNSHEGVDLSDEILTPISNKINLRLYADEVRGHTPPDKITTLKIIDYYRL